MEWTYVHGYYISKDYKGNTLRVHSNVGVVVNNSNEVILQIQLNKPLEKIKQVLEASYKAYEEN